MTPLQLANLECSNYNQSTGACKGIGIDDTGRVFSIGTKPKCVLSTPSVRCAFFEECVLPMIPKIEPTPVDDVVKGDILRSRNRRETYEEAARQYRLVCNIPQAALRSCECGRPLEPRKKLCYVCSEANRKESYRLANQKRG